MAFPGPLPKAYGCSYESRYAARSGSTLISNITNFTLKIRTMEYSNEVKNMCCVAKGPKHANAPIPEEGKWVHAKEIKDISGLTHGVVGVLLSRVPAN